MMINDLVEPSENGSAAQSDDDSSRATHRRNDADAMNKEAERTTLAKRENVVVTRMKGIVAVVLVAASVLVSTGVFLYTRGDQVHDFEDSFNADADRLLDSFHKSLERTLEAVDSLSVAITGHALETNSTFPNVTLPNFALRFGNARVLSGSPYLEYLPLVTEETRAGWEAYAKEHAGQYMEAFETDQATEEYQDLHFGHKDNERYLQQSSPPSGQILSLGRNGTMAPALPGSGPYLPVFQFNPLMAPLLNTNGLAFPLLAGGFKETLRTGQAVVDIAAMRDGSVGTGAFLSIHF